MVCGNFIIVLLTMNLCFDNDMLSWLYVNALVIFVICKCFKRNFENFNKLFLVLFELSKSKSVNWHVFFRLLYPVNSQNFSVFIYPFYLKIPKFHQSNAKITWNSPMYAAFSSNQRGVPITPLQAFFR